MKRPFVRLVLALLPLALGGCDMLGIESASDLAAKRDAEGKAIGGACRYSARSIEQCFAINKRADKAAVFAGWRDMNDYMRENKMEAVPPEIAGQGSTKAAEASSDASSDKKTGDGSDKGKAKSTKNSGA